MNLRSPLRKVRGLGPAKSGTHHWWMQAVTSIALIPLVIWFVCIVIKSTKGSGNILDNLGNPFNATLMILFLGVMLYHGAIGMRVIIEDYVKCGRASLIMFTNFVTAATAVAVILSVAFMHFGQAKHYIKGKRWENSGGIESTGFFADEKHQRWKKEFYEIMKKENRN